MQALKISTEYLSELKYLRCIRNTEQIISLFNNLRFIIYKRLLPHMRKDLNARSATHTVRSYGENFQCCNIYGAPSVKG
jgi:hypothetical protein